DHRVGERAQLAHRVVDGGEAEQIAAPHPQQLATAVEAQARLERVARQRAGASAGLPPSRRSSEATSAAESGGAASSSSRRSAYNPPAGSAAEARPSR